MKYYNIFTPETATLETKETLQSLTDKIGFLPNVFAVMGGTPAALDGFVALNQSFGSTTLSATEREIVQIAASVENRGAYCVAGHTSFAKKQGISDEIVMSARTCNIIRDPKFAALQKFTRLVTIKRYNFDAGELEEFIAAGYNRSQAIEVILGVCVKMFSNLMDNVFQFPLDDEFTEHVWDPKSVIGSPDNATKAA
jgi:AhpD family alkylhydroperoxidase